MLYKINFKWPQCMPQNNAAWTIFISTCTLKAILFHSENLHFKTRNNMDILDFSFNFYGLTVFYQWFPIINLTSILTWKWFGGSHENHKIWYLTNIIEFMVWEHENHASKINQGIFFKQLCGFTCISISHL